MLKEVINISYLLRLWTCCSGFVYGGEYHSKSACLFTAVCKCKAASAYLREPCIAVSQCLRSTRRLLRAPDRGSAVAHCWWAVPAPGTGCRHGWTLRSTIATLGLVAALKTFFMAAEHLGCVLALGVTYSKALHIDTTLQKIRF